MIQDGLTRDQAAVILRDAVPGAEVVGVQRMSGGDVNGVYEVLCADSGQNAVVKVYAADAGWRLSKEISVYRILREHGVTKIPQLLAGAGRDSPLEQPYLVMSRLPGTAAGLLSPELSDADLRSLYRQMGRLLAQIHAIEQEAYGYRATEILDPQPTSVAATKSTLARVSKAYLDATEDRDLYEAAHTYVDARKDLFALCQKPVLVHNDFHEGNILVTQTSDGPVVTGLIDVENAMAGDPIADLAKTHSYSIRDSRTKLDGFFEGYGQIPIEWERRFRLFHLLQGFELWGYFHE